MQLSMLRLRFAHLSTVDFENLPLFPTASGGFVLKHRAVRTFWFAAKVFKEELWTSSGALRFGGHVLRITMAMYLGKLGVDIWRIQLLGRWGSSAVLRYVRESPLQNLHSLADLVMGLQRDSSCMTELHGQSSPLSATSAAHLPFNAVQAHELEQLDGYVRPQQVHGTKYLANTNSGVVHIPLVWSIGLAPESWRTRCGWCFGLPPSHFKGHSGDVALHLRCSRCWRTQEPSAVASEVEGDEEDLVLESERLEVLPVPACVENQAKQRRLNNNISFDPVGLAPDAHPPVSTPVVQMSDEERLAQEWWQKIEDGVPSVCCYVPPAAAAQAKLGNT
jgi:hypothetical protein